MYDLGRVDAVRASRAPLHAIAATQVMPETPRWLVQKVRLDEARLVLARLGSRDGTLEEIQAAVAREADQQGAGWGAVFKPKTRGVRRAILVGVGVGAAQQMLAEEALLFYLPRILLDLGETRNRVYAALVGMGVLKTLCIVVAAIYLDKAGRRPMLLGSVAGMGVSLLVIGTAFSAGLPVLAVVSTWTYMMSFSLGIGPGCWLVASEVFPLVIRAKCMALATVANRVFSSLIASTFLSWAGAMSYAGYFYFFSCGCAAPRYAREGGALLVWDRPGARRPRAALGLRGPASAPGSCRSSTVSTFWSLSQAASSASDQSAPRGTQ